MGSKKTVYKAGDTISNVYFILSGTFLLTFHDRHIELPVNTIVGDYEPANNLSRRTSSLRARSQSTIVCLPFDFYFNVKEQVIREN